MAETLPPGWGFHPATPAELRLPDPAQFAGLGPGERNRAIADALRSVPGLIRATQPRDLVAHFGLPETSARSVWWSAKGVNFDDARAVPHG